LASHDRRCTNEFLNGRLLIKRSMTQIIPKGKQMITRIAATLAFAVKPSIFGPQKPPGSNANYVQTLPGKGWFTYFRLYGPKAAYFDKAWQLNDIEEVK
jgi:hypothetical protein